MSTIHEFEGERRLFVKGAAGDLAICDRTVENEIVPLTEEVFSVSVKLTANMLVMH